MCPALFLTAMFRLERRRDSECEIQGTHLMLILCHHDMIESSATCDATIKWLLHCRLILPFKPNRYQHFRKSQSRLAVNCKPRGSCWIVILMPYLLNTSKVAPEMNLMRIIRKKNKQGWLC